MQLGVRGAAYIHALTGAVDEASYREARARYLGYGVLSRSLLDGLYDRRLAVEAFAEVGCIRSPRFRRRMTHALWNADPACPRWPRFLAFDVLVSGIRHHRDANYGAARDCLTLVAESRFVAMPVRLCAMEQRAMSARVANDDDYAESGYHVLVGAAARYGDSHMERRGRLGLAYIAAVRGDFATSDGLTENVFADAKRHGDRAIVALASAHLGVLAAFRCDYRAAYLWSMAALPDLSSETARNRARHNAAEALFRMGRVTDARALASWVATRADEAYTRMHAAETFVDATQAPAGPDPTPGCAPAPTTGPAVPAGPARSRRAGERAASP